ncbi:MAG: RNA-processing protein [Nanoarchaeota archaeon]|nr:RNA-processing protein [Nanoarchaeota archaeon]
MAEFSYAVKIPKERIAVLIGTKGEVKKQIEDATSTRLNVDSKEGDISVSGGDALSMYSTRDIIKAIGRGFNPDVALYLLKPDFAFEVINLPEFEKPSQFMRIKGRIIGRSGRSRELIEEHTQTNISVYGKTVSIIGRAEDASVARKAIEMIIKGSPHANVYKWLERMRKELTRRVYEEKFEDYVRKDNDEESEEESEKKK